MEYQGFVVDAFERDPGNWRAKLSRSSGRPLITGRKKIWRFVTSVDATTASAALLIALAAIDAGTFARAASLPEKFWRRRGQRSNTPARTVPQANRGTRHSIERARIRTSQPSRAIKKIAAELTCMPDADGLRLRAIRYLRWRLKLARMVRRISLGASLNGQPNYWRKRPPWRTVPLLNPRRRLSLVGTCTRHSVK